MSRTSVNPKHRSLFFYTDENLFFKETKYFLDYLNQTEQKIFNGFLFSDSSKEFNKVNKIIERFKEKRVKLEAYTYILSDSIIGKTIDFAIIIFKKIILPNEMVKIINSVRSGGIIVILGKLPEDYSNPELSNPTLIELQNTNYDKSHLAHWVQSNIKNSENCYFNNDDRIILSKSFSTDFDPRYILQKSIKDINITVDQYNVITELLKISQEVKRSETLITITANRGTGKSSALGIFLGLFLSNNPQIKNIIISGISKNSIELIKTFFIKTIAKLNLKYRYLKQSRSYNVIKVSNRYTLTFTDFKSISVPIYTDLLILDEAASIPINSLKRIVKEKYLKIFLTTTHGYEGTGKAFSFKFLKSVEESGKYNHLNFSLNQPIRYRADDHVEKLIYRIFLLDVELQDLDNVNSIISQNDLSIQFLKDKEILFSLDYAQKLRNIFSILIHGHYRNQPNDLLLLSDSPKHLLTKISISTDRQEELVIGTAHLSVEGGIENPQLVLEEDYHKGDLIPLVGIRYLSEKIAPLIGIRFVRIAIRPDLVLKGLGRKFMDLFFQELSNMQLNLDWVGTSFGSSIKLVKWWGKFGFFPIHIRSIKSSETGEWSIVMIRPLNEPSMSIFTEASRSFLTHFLVLLRHSLSSMKPEHALETIQKCKKDQNYKLILDKSQEVRLKNYYELKINFISSIDVIYEISKAYFCISNNNILNKSQSILLIQKVIQRKTWDQVASYMNLETKTAISMVHKAFVKIVKNLTTLGILKPELILK